MKHILKSILKSLGLLNVAKNIVRKIKSKNQDKLPTKYRSINSWPLKFHNLDLEFDTTDEYSKRWFFPRYDNGNIHEPKATEIFIEYINRDSTVLDIGAHLGYFSCIAGTLASEGKVHVFEVDPKCINLIRKNIRMNGLENVVVNNNAVSDLKGTVKIPRHENPNPSLIINSITKDKYLEVDSIVIDDFLSEQGIIPDFIKIDIEGAEYLALNGMKNTLKNHNATLLVEIHVNVLRNSFNTDYKDVIQLLLNNGYMLEEIEHRSSEGNKRKVDSTTILQGNTMILCTKN